MTNQTSSSMSVIKTEGTNKSLYTTLHFNLLTLDMPDVLLLWRAVVRQTHDMLRKHINPTNVARSVLSKDHWIQIAQTELTEGRLEAVDQLIDMLLKLKDLRWTNSFPITLQTQHSDVYAKVKEVKEGLLKEDVFSKCRYTVADTITSDGGILELQEFGVRLEIPGGAIREKEYISVSVISPKDDHPPLGDHFIVAPMVMLEPDGLQFVKPIMLSVKHSAVDLKLRNLQVWNKTGDNGTVIRFIANSQISQI